MSDYINQKNFIWTANFKKQTFRIVPGLNKNLPEGMEIEFKGMLALATNVVKKVKEIPQFDVQYPEIDETKTLQFNPGKNIFNLQLFEKLFNETEQSKFGQQMKEWKFFLEYLHSYFTEKEISKPLVVEIGVCYGNQKKFYTELLNAEYISIDISDKNSKIDIVGDSSKSTTLDALKTKLKGRQIDLLFIDGWHTYEAVKTDYELYSPLVKHIVVIHDIHTTEVDEADRGQPIGVMQYWNELSKQNKDDTFITLRHHNGNDSKIFTFKGEGRQMGIGIIVKGEIL